MFIIVLAESPGGGGRAFSWPEHNACFSSGFADATAVFLAWPGLAKRVLLPRALAAKTWPRQLATDGLRKAAVLQYRVETKVITSPASGHTGGTSTMRRLPPWAEHLFSQRVLLLGSLPWDTADFRLSKMFSRRTYWYTQLPRISCSNSFRFAEPRALTSGLAGLAKSHTPHVIFLLTYNKKDFPILTWSKDYFLI